MNARRSILALVAFLSAGLSLQARAQNAKLQPVDQGVADRGPLSASQRVLPGDLRVPSGFDRVYRVGPATASGGKFARISGGITAVFPRSQYVPTPDGYAAQTPAGTVYYIGRLPRTLLDDPKAPSRLENPDYRPPGFDDRSARRAIPDRPLAASSPARPSTPPTAKGPRAVKAAPPMAQGSPPSRPTIFSDEAYRSRRVAELLDAATLAGKTRR